MKNIFSQIVSQILLTCLVVFVSLTVPAFAQVQKSQHSEAELVSEVESIQPGQPFWVALRLKADSEWHTYWQNPGDSAGSAPKISWKVPEGFEIDEVLCVQLHFMMRCVAVGDHQIDVVQTRDRFAQWTCWQ